MFSYFSLSIVMMSCLQLYKHNTIIAFFALWENIAEKYEEERSGNMKIVVLNKQKLIEKFIVFSYFDFDELFVLCCDELFFLLHGFAYLFPHSRFLILI